MSLLLDHVSVQAPAVDAAVEMLRDRLGLVTTPTPAAPHRHGRVYLDRSYLEVAAGGFVPRPLLPALRPARPHPRGAPGPRAPATRELV